MNYWITTHWPPRIDDNKSFTGTGVWIPEGRQQAADDLTTDDLIVIYETKSGRTEIREFQDGTTKKIPCKLGREDMICYGRVESPISAIPDSQPQKYVGGTEIWWRWHAPASILSRSGFLNSTLSIW